MLAVDLNGFSSALQRRVDPGALSEERRGGSVLSCRWPVVPLPPDKRWLLCRRSAGRAAMPDAPPPPWACSWKLAFSFVLQDCARCSLGGLSCPSSLLELEGWLDGSSVVCRGGVCPDVFALGSAALEMGCAVIVPPLSGDFLPSPAWDPGVGGCREKHLEGVSCCSTFVL